MSDERYKFKGIAGQPGDPFSLDSKQTILRIEKRDKKGGFSFGKIGIFSHTERGGEKRVSTA